MRSWQLVARSLSESDYIVDKVLELVSGQQDLDGMSAQVAHLPPSLVHVFLHPDPQCDCPMSPRDQVDALD